MLPYGSMDIVTQLQEEVNSLSSLYWNHTGILQRDAPPLSVGEEAVPVDVVDMPMNRSGFAVKPRRWLRQAEAVVDFVASLDASDRRVHPAVGRHRKIRPLVVLFR